MCLHCAFLSLDCHWKIKYVTFHFNEQSYAHADLHHHLPHCTMQHHIQVCACQCLSVSSVCVCCPDACLLAWHLEPAVVKIMSVQVCSESTSHAEVVQMTFNLSRLRTVSWWTCCPPGTTPPHPTEVAMLSTHSKHLAEK